MHREKSNKMIPAGTANGKPKQAKAFICNVCNVCNVKEGRVNVISYHIEANHLEGISVVCGVCDKTFSSRFVLSVHKNKFHK